jgi:hypothetical protein
LRRIDKYDLVVLTVENLDEAVRVLHGLHMVTVDTYYTNDRAYRVGRGLTEAEVPDRPSRAAWRSSRP